MLDFEKSASLREIASTRNPPRITASYIPNAVANLIFIKGFRGSSEKYKNFTSFCNQNGINVIQLDLPYDPEDASPIETYRTVFEKALFETGGMLSKIDPTLPTVLAAHSLGGFLTTDALHNPEKALKLAQVIDAFHINAPFYRSRLHGTHPLSPAFRAASRLIGYIPVGQSRLERVITGNKDQYNIDTAPTHLEALRMHHGSKTYTQRFLTKTFPDFVTELDIQMMLPSDDRACCLKTSAVIGRLLNADMVSIKDHHSPLYRNRDAQAQLVDFVHRQSQKRLMEPAIRPENY